MAKKRPLKVAVGDHRHVAGIVSGRIPIEGVEPHFVSVRPQIAAYRRMVRDVEFDVCELAPTTYIIARSFGAPFVALPIFLSRRFHHAGLLVRTDAGISAPKDLEGKRVGVRAYSVTTGVWMRGILTDEYGLNSSAVTWVVDDEEHVGELRLPENVVHAPPGRPLAAMMAAGELQAGFEGNAGIGRSGPPVEGWERRTRSADDYRELFADPQALEAEWFRRRGVYPMHGALVVKESLVAEHPWLAKALCTAFSQAKQEWLLSLDSSDAVAAEDEKYRVLRKIVGPDPLPYGLEANLPSIEALIGYAAKQHLIPRPIPVDRLFIDPALT